MLSRFHLIPEPYGRTDRRTDLLYQYRASVCWRVIKITDRSFRYASPCLWNQLPDSFRQPRQSCLDSPPHSLVSSSQLSSPLSSSITPSLQAQNLHFQQILPTLDFFLPTGLPSWQRDWTGPIMIIVLFLASHFNFLFVPCGGLSWLPVSFLLHVKYKQSYRIVRSIDPQSVIWKKYWRLETKFGWYSG